MNISAAVSSLRGSSAVVFIFGLLVGSFLNVVIWRLTAEEQIIRGRSHCRSCGKMIAWYDNVPLVSFLMLMGRCRHCRAKISWLYPVIELATGLLFVAVFRRFGLTAEGVVYGALVGALIALTAIDAREMILPDEITLPGAVLGLAVSFLVPTLHGTTGRFDGLFLGFLGALAGGGLLWLIGLIGSWIFKKEAMGGGDVKMMAMVGAVIGWQKVLLVNLILAPLIGSAVGLVLKYRFGKELIPFGPFLSAGTIAAIFYGDAMVYRYFSLIGFR